MSSSPARIMYFHRLNKDKVARRIVPKSLIWWNFIHLPPSVYPIPGRGKVQLNCNTLSVRRCNLFHICSSMQAKGNWLNRAGVYDAIHLANFLSSRRVGFRVGSISHLSSFEI